MNLVKRKIRDMRELKIQGAENVAKAAVLELKKCADKSTALTKTRLLRELEKTRQELFKSRATEPLMRNTLSYILSNIEGKDAEELKEGFYSNVKYALDHFRTVENKIADIGANKIGNGMVVFTHCYSPTVMAILKKAKQKGRSFEVYNTETRPSLHGRVAASELNKLGVPVTHYVDSAMRLAVKEADIVLLGADAITPDKVISKIGSEMVAELANRYDIPVFVCSNSWRFDYKSIFDFGGLEPGKAKEIWNNPPKNVKVCNYAFEKIELGLVTAVISEIGVYRPSVFIEEVKRNYGWMCRDIKLI
ncbi:hypothetical protein CMO89_00605 [Candidatus Woesearchaeota archaeon]|nr:hypothetical protein [Candidatus Woesearchaeota archaeon]|tara:strand:+ start:12695 stop:13612 length:918 start_codon:yes stop_codon:yes gene_type:complete